MSARRRPEHADALSVFITVGTTRFDELIEAVVSPAFAAAALQKGARRVVVQVGNSAIPRVATPPPAACDDSADASWSVAVPAALADGAAPVVRFELYRFKPSLLADIEGAHFVVSHAGAGSIFEALRAGKPLLVVVNAALADNHQEELAGAMAAAGHCWSCDPATLAVALGAADFAARVPLPPPTSALARFVAGVDTAMGFVGS